MMKNRQRLIALALALFFNLSMFTALTETYTSAAALDDTESITGEESSVQESEEDEIPQTDPGEQTSYDDEGIVFDSQSDEPSVSTTDEEVLENAYAEADSSESQYSSEDESQGIAWPENPTTEEPEQTELDEVKDTGVQTDPISASEDSEEMVWSEGLTWVLDENGTLTISGEGVMPDLNAVDEQPWYLVSNQILQVQMLGKTDFIGAFAFSECKNLTNVQICDSVTSIHESAFYDCTKLETIVLPNCVKVIGKAAFKDCSSLNTVIVENNQPIHVHKWDKGTITTPATCKTKGVKTFTCSGCHQTRTEEIDIDPTKHTGDTERRGYEAATATEDGYTGDTWCLGCKKQLSSGKVIPATGAPTPTNPTPTDPTPTDPEPVNPTYENLTEAQKQQADDTASALEVDAETAAQMVQVAEQMGVSTDVMQMGSKKLASMNVDTKDPKGSNFHMLNARAPKRATNSLTVQWKKHKKADGYLVYGNKCGKKNKLQLLKTFGKKITKWTQKKLKKGTYYKYIVIAYKNVNGQKMPIAASVTVHASTKGGKKTVAKSVTVTQGKKAVSKLTLKKKASVTIKASEVPEEKMKISSHRKVKFESDNTAVATVDAKGKITAKKKGTATIYAYAQNGIFKTVKVTVK